MGKEEGEKKGNTLIHNRFLANFQSASPHSTQHSATDLLVTISTSAAYAKLPRTKPFILP